MTGKETLEFIGKATAVVALLFSIFSYTYNQKLERDRIRYATSIDLIERYRKDGIRQAETQLDQRMLYYVTISNGQDLNDPNDYPERLFAALAKEVLFGFTDTPGQESRSMLPELFLIADFYGEVGFCLEHEMCQGDVLRNSFCPRAKEFMRTRSRIVNYYTTYSTSGTWINGLKKFLAGCP